MNIGARLETVGSLVPAGCCLADIGTDHAYLPVWLLQQGRIAGAIAGDIAEGPCQAARTTIAMYGMGDKVQVRLGSGLEVLRPGEADCIAIAGMGASTMIEIFEASPEVFASAGTLVLQPMAGAAALRRYLYAKGWVLQAEKLVGDPPHFYEIMRAVPALCGSAPLSYSEAEYVIGPVLLAEGHPLLGKHIERQLAYYRRLVENMSRSQRAKESEKYAEAIDLVAALEKIKGDVRHA